jgi:hypothetical protein
MRYTIDSTIYRVDANPKKDWNQVEDAKILFESDSREEASEFFENYQIESYIDHGNDQSLIDRPASIRVISFLETQEHEVIEHGFKYLEKY